MSIVTLWECGCAPNSVQPYHPRQPSYMWQVVKEKCSQSILTCIQSHCGNVAVLKTLCQCSHPEWPYSFVAMQYYTLVVHFHYAFSRFYYMLHFYTLLLHFYSTFSYTFCTLVPHFLLHFCYTSSIFFVHFPTFPTLFLYFLILVPTTLFITFSFFTWHRSKGRKRYEGVPHGVRTISFLLLFTFHFFTCHLITIQNLPQHSSSFHEQPQSVGI